MTSEQRIMPHMDIIEEFEREENEKELAQIKEMMEELEKQNNIKRKNRYEILRDRS